MPVFKSAITRQPARIEPSFSTFRHKAEIFRVRIFQKIEIDELKVKNRALENELNLFQCDSRQKRQADVSLDGIAADLITFMRNAEYQRVVLLIQGSITS